MNREEVITHQKHGEESEVMNDPWVSALSG